MNLPVETFKLDSPLMVYNASVRDIARYVSLLLPDSGETVEDPDGVFIQDNLLSLKTLDIGSTGSVLTLSIPSSDPKAAYLQVEKFIDFKGKSYIIKNTQESFEGSETILNVHAERWWYHFLHGGHSMITGYDGYDAATAISHIMMAWKSGEVNWSAGVVDNSAVLPYQITTVKNTLERLKEIESLWGGYLMFDLGEKKVHLIEDPGRDRGVYFTYDHDVKSITRTVDTSELVTRLQLFRPSGIYIFSPSGTYIETNYQWTDRAYDGYLTFGDEYTEQAAWLIAREYLKTVSLPKISYSVTLADLTGREEEIDRFEVLDKVSVYDKNLDRVVKARIEEMEIDWIEPHRSKVVLGSRLSNLSSQRTFIPQNFGGVGDIPNAPEVWDAVSVGYYDGEKPSSKIVAVWDAVTHATNGKEINISYYMVDISPLTTYNTPQLSTELLGLEPGITVNVSLCAVSDKGVPSVWTDPIEVTTIGPSP